MADRILMTPAEVRECATFMNTTAENIMSEVDSINSRVNEVVANWEGASQVAFNETWQSMYQPALHETFPETIRSLSEMLKTAADTLEQTDETIASSMKA